MTIYQSLKQKSLDLVALDLKTTTLRHPSTPKRDVVPDDRSQSQNKRDVAIAVKPVFKMFALSTRHYLNRKRLVQDVDCKAIADGDGDEIEKATNLSYEKAREGYGVLDYLQMTSTCSDFILNREYITSSLTDEEKDFPIAYSILMYKSVEQSERLLRTIYRPQNIYCIHVDAKTADAIFKAVKSITDCFDNVFVLEERLNVTWGTFSVLEPELQCMRRLMKSNKYWKYFINLTGQEFPLRTNYELVKILKDYNGANDIKGNLKFNENIRYAETIPPPHGIVATKGDVHIVASRGYVNFILHDPRAQDLLEWVRNTTIPDETFFSTLNYNRFLKVPGSYNGTLNVGNDTKISQFHARYKLWRNGDRSDRFCSGTVVRSICVFGIGEVQYLAYAKELFANKFYLDYKHYAFDCMEELIYNRTRDEYLGILDFDSSWYSKLEYVTNKIG
ncbi:hypothetical protein ACF0H5_012301 [Mactra antiquata]